MEFMVGGLGQISAVGGTRTQFPTHQNNEFAGSLCHGREYDDWYHISDSDSDIEYVD